MNTVTKQHKPVDTGFVFSIAPAVDLAELDNAMREFARQPWEAGKSKAQGCKKEVDSCSGLADSNTNGSAEVTPCH